jgi:hypothetical protein
MPVKRISPKTEEKKSVFQDYRCYATYHPRSVLLGGFEFEDKIAADFSRFNLRSLAYPERRFPHGKTIGFDTEYAPDSALLTIGVGAATGAEAVEVTDTKGIAQAKKVIKNAKTLVGHSITGDLDQLVKLGLAKDNWLRGENVLDSFLLARMADENRGRGGYGLEALLLSEFNSGAWKGDTEKLLKRTGNASDWSPEQRTERCRLDAWATVVLAEYFTRLLRDFSKAKRV